MPIPRRLIVIAAGALGAGVVMYLRNKTEQKRREQRDHDESLRKDAPPPPASDASQTSQAAGGAATTDGADAAAGSGVPGAEKELARFLAGESWHDEMGWNGIWDREGIEGPDGWLRAKGKEVLGVERKKLVEHPALLAGCRRRWIVVCRYAGIDVADAANLWNQVSEA